MSVCVVLATWSFLKLCRTAADILEAVQSTISQHKAGKVVIVGHSLGCSIAMIDGVYLSLHISGITLQVIGYGCPRVCFLFTSLDSVPIIFRSATKLSLTALVLVSFSRILQTKKMLFPPFQVWLSCTPLKTLEWHPSTGRLLGYVGPDGEVHIAENDSWLACAGQDNTSTDCSTGDVPNIFEGNISDHDGPYNGITMGC